MGHFGSRRIRIRLEESDRRHQEAGHTECALEALFVDDTLLDRMKLAVGGRKSFNADNVLAASGVRENRAGIMRHIVDEDGAGAALGAVATQFRAGKPSLYLRVCCSVSFFMTSTRRCCPLTFNVTSRSTAPGADA